MATRRAVLSVSDKRGIVELGRGLARLGFEILSTGGTADALTAAGVPVVKVSDYTGAPEVFGGRVKTLHPRVFGGILFRRGEAGDEAEAKAQGIAPIDLVAVNLYPFEATVARGAPFEEIIENIDIGGPSLLRAAAKNWESVGSVVDPDDYPRVLEELERGGALSEATRRALMKKTFAHTAAYDAAIARWLTGDELPDLLVLSARKAFQTRYGENPHQKAAFYRERREPAEPAVAFAEVLGGKELSYNNLLDLEAALDCLKEFDEASCVIVKHNTPCGVASGQGPEEAYRKARATDEESAFGGIVALNRPVDSATGKALAEIFLEAVIAPGFDEAARAALSGKKNLRLLALPSLAGPRSRWKRGGLEVRSVAGGFLVQDRDVLEADEKSWKVVSKRAPTPDELAAARFAWKVVKHVKSNAVVFARAGQVAALGGGQTSRVEAVRGAVRRAALPLAGTSMASDAFFPFRDSVDEAIQAGATCIVQPGGSIRDAESISAADERGASMILTGVRHFRH
jgi:phosphoribosylaminoimidazolecarboxamide formyltransferase/IMP cyclohydrolase